MPRLSASDNDLDQESLTAMLAAQGFVAADEEAAEMLAASHGDLAALAALVDRRLAGEPLAWLVGRTPFADLDIAVTPGVYVPRWQSLELARRAAAALPQEGAAVDVCTGSGAIACALRAARPRARVVGTDIDETAIANARANGVEAYLGDLFTPVPSDLTGRLDVVTAVVPYVPTDALKLLPRDTLAYEDRAHYDGGTDGTLFLRRVAAAALTYLCGGGRLFLELGGDQADVLKSLLELLGYHTIEKWTDDDGDVRGVEATLG